MVSTNLRIQRGVAIVAEPPNSRNMAANSRSFSLTVTDASGFYEFDLEMRRVELQEGKCDKYLVVDICNDYIVSRHVDRIFDLIRYRTIGLYLTSGRGWGISQKSSLMPMKSIIWVIPHYCISTYLPLMKRKKTHATSSAQYSNSYCCAIANDHTWKYYGWKQICMQYQNSTTYMRCSFPAYLQTMTSCMTPCDILRNRWCIS